MIAKPFEIRSEQGFVLATVLVLLLVLTLSAFAGAMLTRTDIQLVNNAQNEKQAFYVAEAGVSEARLRLNLVTPTNATVDGNTFDASLTGSYLPDTRQTGWQAQILFGGTGPAKTGNTVTTPTLQPQASRMAYSNAAGDTESLTVSWDICATAAASAGCSAAGAIRQLGGRYVLLITSTGRSSQARRRITQRVGMNNVSSVVLRADLCPGVRTQGSGAVSFPGAVQVNSVCSTALSAGGSSSISSTGTITTSGTGYSGNVTPAPQTGTPQISDPLASLPAPSFAGRPIRGIGTASTPVQFQTSGTQTIQPGIYYGGISMASGSNVTLAPGIYIMAGGGFSISSNAQAASQAGGVMIYNTCAVPPAGGGACTLSGLAGYGAISISANRAVNLSAPTNATDATYAGIGIFQDRMNSQAVSITAGATGRLDALIYAKLATISMSGNADLLHAQLVVGAIDLQGGPMIGTPATWIGIGNGGSNMVSWQDF